MLDFPSLDDQSQNVKPDLIFPNRTIQKTQTKYTARFKINSEPQDNYTISLHLFMAMMRKDMFFFSVTSDLPKFNYYLNNSHVSILYFKK